MKRKKYNYGQFSCSECGKQLTESDFNSAANFFKANLTIAFYTCGSCRHTDSVTDEKAEEKREEFLKDPFKSLQIFYTVIFGIVAVAIITYIFVVIV